MPTIGTAADQLVQRHLNEARHQRREDEQPPHAVDDARHGGEEFHGRADRLLQPGRRQLGEENSDPEADGNADDERDQGGRQGAGDSRPRAVNVLVDVPYRRRQEVASESPESGPRAPHHRGHDARENEQDRQGGGVAREAETRIEAGECGRACAGSRTLKSGALRQNRRLPVHIPSPSNARRGCGPATSISPDRAACPTCP